MPLRHDCSHTFSLKLFFQLLCTGGNITNNDAGPGRVLRGSDGGGVPPSTASPRAVLSRTEWEQDAKERPYMLLCYHYVDF